MAEDEKQAKSTKPSFWTTLPGILTGLAALITAMTGLLIGLHQNNPAGKNDASSKAADSRPAQGPSNANSASTAPGAQPIQHQPVPEAGVAVQQKPAEVMARIESRNGNTTEIRERSVRLLMDRYVPLDGGQKVPFEQLRSIEFLEFSDRSDVKVRLTLLNNSTINGFMRACVSGCDIVGENQLGSFVLPVRETKSVTFQR